MASSEQEEPRLVKHFSVKRVRREEAERIMDTVAAEEPLEIRASYWFKDAQIADSVALTMRTPGSDRELAVGFLYSEGIIRGRAEIVEVRALGSEPSNEIVIELARGVEMETWRLARNTFVNSSCGVCGKRSREAIQAQVADESEMAAPGAGFRVGIETIERLPELVRREQQGFVQTGGLHAAALVGADGSVEKVFEDIGRHNALDKLIGWCVMNGRVPLTKSILFLSSRSSFELVQKTVMAGAPVLATVGGPSSLAIETARELGLTLIGFVREERFNIYSGDWRIKL